MLWSLLLVAFAVVLTGMLRSRLAGDLGFFTAGLVAWLLVAFLRLARASGRLLTGWRRPGSRQDHQARSGWATLRRTLSFRPFLHR